MEIDAYVSDILLTNIYTLQKIYRCWDRKLNQVDVRSNNLVITRNKTVRESFGGLFFSLGVDSFYTLLKHNTTRDISHLICVSGFDIYHDHHRRDLISDIFVRTHAVSKIMNMHFLSIETNVRRWFEVFDLEWGVFSHGPSMASVGLALEGLLDRIYISSSFTFDYLVSWGSHPMIDPLWSTEKLTFIHYGCDMRRIDKIRYIANFDVPMDNLRVCAGYPPEAYNCGQCLKCLRAMVRLHLVGALERCRTLPHSIDVEKLRSIPLSGEIGKFFTYELIDELGSSPTDLAIREALEDSLAQASDIGMEDIFSVVPKGDTFILVDQDQWEAPQVVRERRRLPFLERAGQYWGPPADDATAISELERLRQSGAKFVVFAPPGFWWLDYYSGFDQHLRTRYRCVLRNRRVIIFDVHA